MSDSYVPRWQQVIGPARCQECGAMAETTWRYFAEVATWTHCYCEACVEELLSKTPTE